MDICTSGIEIGAGLMSDLNGTHSATNPPMLFLCCMIQSLITEYAEAERIWASCEGWLGDPGPVKITPRRMRQMPPYGRRRHKATSSSATQELRPDRSDRQ